MTYELRKEAVEGMPDLENQEAYNNWVEAVRRQDLEHEKENYSIQESNIEGKGWFAKRDFKAGEVISSYLVGRYEDIRPSDQIEPDSEFDRTCVQCGVTPGGKGLYIAVPNHPRKYINHSCEPNAGIQRRARPEGGWDSELIAIKTIRQGEEIVLDYSTTQLEEWTEPNCRCGTKSCRHTITDFAHLSRDLQDKYIQFGIVPDWMVQAVGKG